MAAWKVLEGVLGLDHVVVYLCCEPFTRIWAVAFPYWGRLSQHVLWDSEEFLWKFQCPGHQQRWNGKAKVPRGTPVFLTDLSWAVIMRDKPAVPSEFSAVPFLVPWVRTAQVEICWKSPWVEHLPPVDFLWPPTAHVLAGTWCEINKSYQAPGNHKTVPYCHSPSAQKNINLDTCQKCCCRFEFLMTSLKEWALFAGSPRMIFSSHRKKYM